MSDNENVSALTATLSQPRPHEKLVQRPTGVKLEVLAGPLEGRSFDLPNRTVLTGGRDPGHDVVLDHESVSSTHFEMRFDVGGVHLRDLGSTNGTWLGRNRLEDGTVSMFDGGSFYAGDVKLRLTQIKLNNVVQSTERHLGTMTGQSPAMAELFSLLIRLAPTPITTLITGETGTGKEEVARTLHKLSKCKGQFVVLDCGAFVASLAESAIFGHKKGAFTGAIGDAKGAFEQAEGGTLLLDEIGELPLELQPKLLRVLDRREVQRIGEHTPRAVDVRVIAATNRNVAQLVADGAFRLDLYHRLRQIEITTVPLRERPEDIPLLAEQFLSQFRRAHGRAVGLEPAALAVLGRQRWDGNVRELRQTIERLAFLVVGDTITAEDLRRFGDDRGVAASAGLGAEVTRWLGMPFKDAADEFQGVYFRALFEAAGGDLDLICARSGYSRKGLQALARRLGLLGAR